MEGDCERNRAVTYVEQRQERMKGDLQEASCSDSCRSEKDIASIMPGHKSEVMSIMPIIREQRKVAVNYVDWEREITYGIGDDDRTREVDYHKRGDFERNGEVDYGCERQR